MRGKCDKCHSDIIMGRCSCGYWFGKKEQPPHTKIYEAAILEFNKQNREISSGDHFTGSCIVLFKGDHDKCMKVVEYIESLNE